MEGRKMIKGRRKGILLLVLIIFITMFYGCGSASSDMAESASAPKDMDYGGGRDDSVQEEDAIQPTANEAVYTSANKMIYRAEITLQTKEFDKTTKSIENKVNEVGGYIESSSINGKGIDENDPKYAYYTLRIPKEKFEYIKKTSENWGNIRSINTNSEDISEQYYDTETMLETKKIQEERLMELLKKAEKLEDIIALERELQEVRYQIQNNTVTIRKMDSLIDYATITVNVYEVDEMTIVPKTFPQEMKEAFKDSGALFIDFIQNATITIIYLLPFLIILIMFIIIFRKRAFKLINTPFKMIRKRKDRE